jgi:anti-sigma B factor antagonist
MSTYEESSAADTGFALTHANQPGASVVCVTGALDLATAPELERALDAAEQEGAAGMVLDLSGITFIDSSALRVLLRSAERLKEHGQLLHVVCGPGPVMRLFELTLLTTTFSVHPTRDEAVAAVRQS